MPFTNPSWFGDILYCFLGIILEGTPYIVIGTFISGLIDTYLPARKLEKFLPRAAVPAIFISGVLGMALPVCECAIVPVIRRLIGKGLPVSCAITYMLSAPIVNPIVAFSTWSAFQQRPEGFASAADYAGFMAVSRLLMGFMVAVIIGLLALKLRPDQFLREALLKVKDGNEGEHDHGKPSPAIAGRAIMRDFLDTTAYFTIGALIASVLNTQINQQEVLSPLASNDYLAIPGMMLFGFALSLCSTSDAFIAAQLTILSSASKLAFLVFGPMMDLKLFFMYLTIFRKKSVFILFIALFLLVGMMALAWNVAK